MHRAQQQDHARHKQPRVEVVCGYALLAELARGGMGVTHIASRRNKARLEFVVVKRPHPELLRETSARRRFYHESLVATSLKDPALVRTLITGEDLQGPFIVSEYVHGITLSDLVDRALLRSQELSMQAALEVGLACLQGLSALHHARSPNGQALNVVHRDICPSNILISTLGEVKVSDFGVAKSQLSTVSTDARYLIGKLPFLAPEYILEHKSSSSVDIYSLGVSLWYILSGRLPHEGRTPAEMMRAIVEHPLPSLREFRDDVPRSFDLLLSRMCSRTPENRPTANEAHLALQSLFMGQRKRSHHSGSELLQEVMASYAKQDLEQRWDFLTSRAQSLQ